jgi:cell division protein FtsW
MTAARKLPSDETFPNRASTRAPRPLRPVDATVLDPRGGADRRGWLRARAAARTAGPVDPWLVATTIALIAFGVVMVYGASAVFALDRYGDGAHFLFRQSVFAAVGVTLMLLVAQVDHRAFKLLTYPALLGTVALLVVVLVMGRITNGASRWIPLGPINVQPSELAKVALILWLAYSLSKKRELIRSFSVGFLPHVLVSGLVMWLCLLQPDFGGAAMIGLLTFVLLFTAGARMGYILGAALLVAPLAFWLVVASDYRMERIRAFLDPFADLQEAGYQVAESLMGFGSGGLTGVGLGESRQKLFYLPEAHTDFIGAIVGEELGFLGIAALVLAYGVLVARGLVAAFRAPDDYATYLAVGISLFLGMQAATNLAVVLALLPTKGLVLPFMSYGGSSLLVNCVAVGILLDVSRARPDPTRPGGDGERGRDALATGETGPGRRGSSRGRRPTSPPPDSGSFHRPGRRGEHA